MTSFPAAPVRPMFERILIPTDGSPHSEKAVGIGCELAQRFNSKIVFLHVLMHGANVDDLVQIPSVGPDLTERVREGVTVSGGVILITVISPEMLKQVGEAILQGAKDTAIESNLLGSVVKLKDGDPSKAIVETAAEVDADVIVMGRRGLSKLESLLQGSTSERVARMAECTCITVH